MLDWNEYQKQIQQQIVEIGRTNRDIVKGYRELSNAGNATNLLGGKVRELIALAVAVTRQCDGCITTHTDAAIKEGATKEEIVEALKDKSIDETELYGVTFFASNEDADQLTKNFQLFK